MQLAGAMDSNQSSCTLYVSVYFLRRFQTLGQIRIRPYFWKLENKNISTFYKLGHFLPIDLSRIRIYSYVLVLVSTCVCEIWVVVSTR